MHLSLKCWFLIIMLNCDILCEEDTSVCEFQKTCDECISRNYLCKWCKDENYGDIRCGTVEELKERRCENIETKQTKMNITGKIDTKYLSIEPKNIDVIFLKHDTIKFNITVKKKEDLNFEIMFLIDYSNTMTPLINKVKDLVNDFVTRKEEYKVSKFGVMKYIDKMSHPIISTSQLTDTRKPIYIELISSLTEDIQKLKDSLDKQQIGVNSDLPEAVFDAVTECAICDSVVGWSKEPTVLKTIFVFTDAISKFQGDGKMIGAITPHDLKCHIGSDGKIKDGGIDFDFVSPGQVAKVLRSANIQLVMVVPRSLIDYYTLIGKSWLGVRWLVVELNQENIDLGQIMVDSNKDLNSRVSLFVEKRQTDEIAVDVTCPEKSDKKTNLECYGVTDGQEVQFSITAKLLKSESPQIIDLKISSIESVKLQIQEVKKCDCSQNITRATCQNKGNMTCGICICDTGSAGYRCQCGSGKTGVKEQCVDPKSKLSCSGRGYCDECGECVCKIANDQKQYSGKYCECSRAMCVKTGDSVCGGPENGQCGCDRCVCNREFTGIKCDIINCDLPEITKKCIKDGSSDLCSNNGKCVCGICKCNLNKQGTYCEDDAAVSCNDFENTVNCFVHNMTVSSEQECSFDTDHIKYDTNTSFECVVYDSSGCRLYFNHQKNINESKYSISVKPFNITDDCPEKMNVLAISAGVFALVLAVGIVLIALYVMATIIYYKAEAKRFSREIDQAGNRGQTNPLYDQKEK